jgi:hypothetical protein
VVIATPGGLVSDSANFNLMLSHCFTVWLQADPADHMSRVAAQGDLRPMAGNKEAMEDLNRILEGARPSIPKPIWPSTPASTRWTTALPPCEPKCARNWRCPPDAARRIKLEDA